MTSTGTATPYTLISSDWGTEGPEFKSRQPDRDNPSLLAFELVVVAVGVVGAVVVFVFVDEDAFLVGEGFVAVSAPVAFTTQDEEPEY